MVSIRSFNYEGNKMIDIHSININTTSYLNRLKGLLPPVSYDPNGEQMELDIKVEARFFNRINEHSKKIINAIVPNELTGDLLVDWERLLGLPIDLTQKYDRRLHKVLQKLAEVGGLSIPYFIGLAKSMGYEIEIIEGEDYIFRAGKSRAGDRIGHHDLVWVWYVNIKIPSALFTYFRAGSGRAGDRLLTAETLLIEEIFNDLKPAHTLCVFNYLGTQKSFI